jgi:hypothetical protein
MLTCAVEHDADVTVGELRMFFRDHNVHMALLVDGGVLAAAVEPADLDGARDAEPALPLGQLDGRTIGPELPIAEVGALMRSRDVRRLAVTVQGDVLVGLLCVKRHRNGFCSNDDVAERAAESEARRANGELSPQPISTVPDPT